jgi:Spy/CpxP family protein refolding chaperone
MTFIKARRDVLALLTPEQRAKEKAEQEKMMQQYKGGGKGHGNPHGGAMKDNPHKGGDAAQPAPPSSMKPQ